LWNLANLEHNLGTWQHWAQSRNKQNLGIFQRVKSRNLQRVKSRHLQRVKSRNLSTSEISESFNERNLGISKWAKFRNLGTCEISKYWNRQILGTSSENL
jgi:hypothetical protein